MSFFTAIADAYGGYGKGKRERAQEEDERAQLAQTQSYQDQQLQLQRDELARQQAVDAQNALLNRGSLRAMGLDENGNPLAPLPLPPGLVAPGTRVQGPATPSPFKIAGKAVGPPVPGATTTAPDWTPEQYLQAAVAAANAGRNDLAKTYIDAGNAASNAALRDATAGLKGAQGQEIVQGKIPEDKARAQYYAGRNKVTLEQMRMTLESAKVRANASVTAAQVAASQRAQSAALSAGARLDAVTLAGYYRLQGQSEDLAVRTAIAEAGNAERYAQAQGTKTGDFSGYDPSQPIQPQSITVNPAAVSLSFSMPIMGADGKITGFKQVPIPAVPGAKPPSNAPTDPAAAAFVGRIQQEIRGGATVDDIVTEARDQGASDLKIRSYLGQANVPVAQINAAFARLGAPKHHIGPITLPF